MTDHLPHRAGDDHRPPAAGNDRDYLVRAEEQLQVGTERVVSGYARLEKVVVTQTRTITVEVSHEEFRLVHHPAPAPGAPAGQLDRAGQLDTARWLSVSREEIVVTKRVVPVERVRLEVYPVTEQRTVTEQVRKEQIDVGDLVAAPSPPI